MAEFMSQMDAYSETSILDLVQHFIVSYFVLPPAGEIIIMIVGLESKSIIVIRIVNYKRKSDC